ncbi:MAG: hypothetical protein CSA36_04305 [Draconibacterium sp.]|nr:MAG: hypothetical protein CSA36_04305 [Draconibacterium sp.]
MKKNRLREMLLLALIMLIGVACTKDDPEPFKAYCDVFQVNRMIASETAGHALAYFVYGQQPIKSATVLRSGDVDPIVLNEIPNTFSFGKEPVESDYDTTVVAAGEFIFNIVPETGEAVNDSDYFSPQNLEIPEIIEVTWPSTGPDMPVIKWDGTTNADFVVVKIKDSEGKYIYSTKKLSPSINSFTTNAVDGSFIVQPEKEGIYTIEVQSFLVEENINVSYAQFNIEELSIGEWEVVWP